MSDGYKRVHESGTVKRQKRKKADEELNKLNQQMGNNKCSILSPKKTTDYQSIVIPIQLRLLIPIQL